MNSIEIAKKLIEENTKKFEDLCTAETILRRRIEEYAHKIDMYDTHTNYLRSVTMAAEEDLQLLQDRKKECLVDKTALKLFVAAGVEMDFGMLD